MRRRRAGSIGCWLAAGALSWCMIVGAAGVGVAASEAGFSRFQRTLLSLQSGSSDAQADFARAALGGLAEIYMAEADLARQEATRREDEGKLLGWSRAVDRYAGQLLVLLEEVDEGLPVHLSVNREGVASVVVGGRTVMLSHPRPGQQGAFEQHVLEEFCARQDCGFLTADPADAAPIAVSASRVAPLWAFTELGPVCSFQGLAVHFDTSENLARKRDTCEQFLHEAVSLALEIAWQRRHGVEVAWDRLAIRPTRQRPEHLVQLNQEGDVVLASLPLLNALPVLLDELKPWLRAGAEGGTAQLDLQAADYGW